MDTTIDQVKQNHERSDARSWTGPLNVLVLLAFCVDLITPLLIWKGVLPSSVRWISHAAIAVMMLGCLVRMIVFNYFPRVVWFAAAVSAVWAVVAVFRGQGIVSTVWGLWLLFQFPLIGLFLYLQPVWPARFPEVLRKLVFACLTLEVAAQLIQYALGEIPGDDLAGTLGSKGTGNLIIFILFVSCVFLGHWIATNRWQGLIVMLGLSIVSSTLGEMKLYLVGLLVIALFALILYGIKNHTVWKLLLYFVLIVATLGAFIVSYNRFVPGASKVPLLSYLNDPQSLYAYLNREDIRYINGNLYTNLGRNAALTIGWESLQGDPVTLLFGWGIGARSESVTLGTAGMGIQQGDLGLTSGTGLLVRMQEMGLVGLATMIGFFLWIIVRLFRDIRRSPFSEANGLRYGVILFSTFWPIWLWYNNAWVIRVAMILYWTTLAYVLAEASGFSIRAKIRSKMMSVSNTWNEG